MKKISLVLILLLSHIFFISCSEKENIEISKEELMTNNSPWTFKNYEMVEIIDSGGSLLTKTEIESITNNRGKDNTMNFNSNGTGSSSSPSGGIVNWKWEINTDNQLKITYDNTNGENDVYNNFKVSNSKLSYEFQSVIFDSSISHEVLHYGNLIFE